MKSLVIYDSAYGNTKLVANKIAEVLGAKLVLAKEFKKSDLDDIDLLIVGSPINAWKPLPAIIDLLDSFNPSELNNIKATSFDTRIKLFIHGDAKDKIAKSLEQAGAKIIAQSSAFYVKGTEGPLFEGELAKAEQWAKQIKVKMEE